MRAIVLAYHAVNIAGNDYASNDHVAFAADLRLLHDLGFASCRCTGSSRNCAARPTAICHAASRSPATMARTSIISTSTIQAMVASAACSNHLIDFRRERGYPAQSQLHLTSFVIASPEARAVIDQRCLGGLGWMGDNWWRAAQASGLIAIENHSWDHNHAELAQTVQHAQVKGTFHSIDNYADADAEIRQASDWLDAACPARKTSLFAYPYGESNDYLVNEYFPRHAHAHRLHAAFGTQPVPIGAQDDHWSLGRYICGHHWSSPEQLRQLLRDGFGAA